MIVVVLRTFAAFVLLYNPTVAVVEASLLRAVVLAGLVIGVLRGAWLRWPRAELIQYILLVAGFVLAFASAQVIAFFGGGDPTFALLVVSSLTGFIPAAYVVARYGGAEGSRFVSLLRIIAVVAAIQSAFIVLDWAFPPAHALFAKLVVQPDLSGLLVRAAGLSSSAGDGLSFAQTIGAISALYLAITVPSRAGSVGWGVVFAMCFISMMFAGRTGIVLVILATAFMGLHRPFRLRVLGVLGSMSAVVVSCVGLVALVMPFEQLTRLVERVLPYAFEFAYSYFSGEGLRTASTDDLRTMVFLPSSGATLLFGTGYFVDPVDSRQNFMGTDVGYVRTIYYVGVIGSGLVYSWYLVMWAVARRAAAATDHVRFVDATFLVLFVAHLKFPFLFLGTAVAIVFALLFALLMDESRCASAA